MTITTNEALIRLRALSVEPVSDARAVSAMKIVLACGIDTIAYRYAHDHRLLMTAFMFEFECRESADRRPAPLRFF